MSLIIKGMEMPKDCDSCCFCLHEMFDKLCLLTNNYYGESGEGSRPEDCPLVPLPEKHGRLIDADTLAETVQQAIGTRGCEQFILDLIEEAETVIPSEGGPDNGN